MNKHENT